METRERASVLVAMVESPNTGINGAAVVRRAFRFLSHPLF